MYYEQQEIKHKDFSFGDLQLSLSKMPGSMVLDNLERYVKSERKIMHIVLAHIYEVHTRRLYFERGFNSTYEYLKHLGYSETPAYERIRAAEMIGKVPEVTEKLETGAINMTQLNQVHKVIRQKNDQGGLVSPEQTASLIELIENKNTFETKKLLAEELNLPVLEGTKINPQSNHTIRIEFSISEEDYKELEKAKSYISHTIPGGEVEKIFMNLIRKFNHQVEGKNPTAESKKDSKKTGDKSQTSKGKFKSKTKEQEYQDIIDAFMGPNESKYQYDLSRDIEDTPETLTQHLVVAAENPDAASNKKRKAVPEKLKQKILRKANYTCEYVSKTGKKCNSKYQLEIDHIKPIWAGGGNTEENLRCLCSAHNRHIYRRQAGYMH